MPNNSLLLLNPSYHHIHIKSSRVLHVQKCSPAAKRDCPNAARNRYFAKHNNPKSICFFCCADFNQKYTKSAGLACNLYECISLHGAAHRASHRSLNRFRDNYHYGDFQPLGGHAQPIALFAFASMRARDGRIGQFARACDLMSNRTSADSERARALIGINPYFGWMYVYIYSHICDVAIFWANKSRTVNTRFNQPRDRTAYTCKRDRRDRKRYYCCSVQTLNARLTRDRGLRANGGCAAINAFVLYRSIDWVVVSEPEWEGSVCTENAPQIVLLRLWSFG